MFSIVTLYYRGDRFLDGLKENLRNQIGGHSFEWIIVDDYSNDGISHTELQRISSSSVFEIKCIFLEKNYLGSESVRRALEILEGEYTIILDQDDKLTLDGLDLFSKALKRHADQEKIAGICGRCVDQNGYIVGKKFPYDEIVANEPTIRHVYRIKGEFFQCTRSEILRSHIKDFEPGYTNGWLWNEISRSYDYVYVNSVVRMYNQNNPSSLSRSKKIRLQNAQYKQGLKYINDNAEYMQFDKLGFLRIILQFARISIHSEVKLSELFDVLSRKIFKWVVFVWPLACVRVFIDRARGALN